MWSVLWRDSKIDCIWRMNRWNKLDFFACWYRFAKIKSRSKNFFVGIVKKWVWPVWSPALWFNDCIIEVNRSNFFGRRESDFNKSTKHWLTFNLDPRVACCQLKCGGSAFQKATKGIGIKAGKHFAVCCFWGQNLHRLQKLGKSSESRNGKICRMHYPNQSDVIYVMGFMLCMCIT